MSLRVQSAGGCRQHNPQFEILTKGNNSHIPVKGFLAGCPAPAAGAPKSLGLVKNVVAVKIPVTVVPGRIGYFVPLEVDGSAKDKSPTLIIRDKWPSLPKKSRMLKYGPPACSSNGIS